MIDPDNIIIADNNNNKIIEINNVPEFNFLVWDLEDDKELKKFFQTIEKEIRGSYEYRTMIQYLKDNYNMNQCSFIKIDNNDETKIKIELHHYPFTLYDLVEIVYRKRCQYGELLEVEMVAKEVTMLHYRLLVGLIPLSKTVHQLVHDSKLFIPVQNVLGNYNSFVNFYKPFCTEEQLDTLNRIELYSSEDSDLQVTTILDMNTISFKTNDNEYILPTNDTVVNKMNNRIEEIKNNNFLLPKKDDIIEIDTKDSIEDRSVPIKPFYFL